MISPLLSAIRKTMAFTGSGEVTAAAKHEEYAHVLEFDYDDMAFYDTGETTYIY